MEPGAPIPLPVASSSRAEHVLADIVAAVLLVAGGGARRVMLAGLPDAEVVALEALAVAQRHGVRFALARNQGAGPSVVVGPVEE